MVQHQTVAGFHALTKNWWIPVIIGLSMLGIAVFMLLNPTIAYLSLSIFFAWMIFFYGILHIAFALSNRKNNDHWGWYLLTGALEFVVGLLMLIFPPLSAEVLRLYMGFWFTFRGAMSISLGWTLKKAKFPGWWWLMLMGFVTMVLSFFIVLDPLFGILSIVVLTALSFVFLGILNLAMGLDLKKLNKQLSHSN